MNLPSQVLSLEGSQNSADPKGTLHDTDVDSEPRGHDKEQNTLSSPDSNLFASVGGSLTWVSDDTKERDKFRRMRSNIALVAPNSPFIPKNMNEWLAHRMAVLEENTKKLDRLIATRKMQQASPCKVKTQPILGGKEFRDIRSTVLARETIWRPGVEDPPKVENPFREQALWPESDERKHEGDQRARSGYDRFLPLPRVQGNSTVNWKQRSTIIAYELDQVGQPVIMHKVSTENDVSMEAAVGMSLLQELDA